MYRGCKIAFACRENTVVDLANQSSALVLASDTDLAFKLQLRRQIFEDGGNNIFLQWLVEREDFTEGPIDRMPLIYAHLSQSQACQWINMSWIGMQSITIAQAEEAFLAATTLKGSIIILIHLRYLIIKVIYFPGPRPHYTPSGLQPNYDKRYLVLSLISRGWLSKKNDVSRLSVCNESI